MQNLMLYKMAISKFQNFDFKISKILKILFLFLISIYFFNFQDIANLSTRPRDTIPNSKHSNFQVDIFIFGDLRSGQVRKWPCKSIPQKMKFFQFLSKQSNYFRIKSSEATLDDSVKIFGHLSLERSSKVTKGHREVSNTFMLITHDVIIAATQN